MTEQDARSEAEDIIDRWDDKVQQKGHLALNHLRSAISEAILSAYQRGREDGLREAEKAQWLVYGEKCPDSRHGTAGCVGCKMHFDYLKALRSLLPNKEI